jgi:hypothetical protein
MGVERSVTRWYVQRQIILNKIALLEAQLEPVPPSVSLAHLPTGEMTDVRSAELLLQLTRTRGKLHSLGPCPRPMMG